MQKSSVESHVEDLLDLSRSDNQQLSIRREVFDLVPSLEQSLKLAKAAYSNPIATNLHYLPFFKQEVTRTG